MREAHARGNSLAWTLVLIAVVAMAGGVVYVLWDSDDVCFTCGLEEKEDAPRLFAADSVWNLPLPEAAPLDPASAPLVKGFAAQIEAEEQAGIGPWIQTDESSTPFYVVDEAESTVRVQVDDRPEPSYVDLQRAFEEVPLPADAQPAAGSDGHLTVYQPSTDRLWEFWQLHEEADGLHASWGGAMEDASGSPGYYTEGAYPGATSQWGSTATSLPVIGGTIMISELRNGEIDHALALDIPEARAGVFAWPAQRTDGTGGPELLPEGARLRLDPALDLDSLDLTPVGRTIADAAQDYGVIVRDRTLHATAFYAEDPTPTGSDPYPEIFSGQTPNEVLAGFPWDRFQVVEMHLCTTAPCPEPG